jgi:fumarate hydratase subunit alpha
VTERLAKRAGDKVAKWKGLIVSGSSASGVRDIPAEEVTRRVRELTLRASIEVPADHRAALCRALGAEESPLGCAVLRGLLANADVAARERLPICQDTGYAVVFCELGQDVHLVGGSLQAAVDEGVRQAWAEGYLRPSLVASPLERRNTGDNTPAFLHLDMVEGDQMRLTVLAKGCGCDNMSALAMLTPAQGRDGVIEFVVETIRKAGPKASPPVTVGVGLGGSFDRAALLAKKALTRESGRPHPDPDVALLEAELLARINDLGIGPAGFGGRITALAVHVETFPTHIAALPVAVNLDCHTHRVATGVV